MDKAHSQIQLEESFDEQQIKKELEHYDYRNYGGDKEFEEHKKTLDYSKADGIIDISNGKFYKNTFFIFFLVDVIAPKEKLVMSPSKTSKKQNLNKWIEESNDLVM